MNIATLAHQFAEQEAEESGGNGGDFGVNAWYFAFKQLSPQELADVEAKGLTFFFEDNSNDSLWEKVQDLISFWEEWSFGELCERMAKLSDRNMDEPEIWDWCFMHMVFTRQDYDFLCSLTDDEASEFALGNSPDTQGEFSKYLEIAENHGGYDIVDLDARLGTAYSDWEAFVEKHTDQWKSVGWVE